MNNTSFNFTVDTTSTDLDLCISGITVQTKEQLENLVKLDFFNQLISRMYWFVLFAVILNLLLYFKFYKIYKLHVPVRLKLGFVLQLFLNMGLYLYASYLKFLINYDVKNLLFFFLLLLPFFYILNIYSFEITDKPIKKILDNWKK